MAAWAGALEGLSLGLPRLLDPCPEILVLVRLRFQTNGSTQTTRHARNTKPAFMGSWLGCGEAKALLQHSVMPGGQALQPTSPSGQRSSPSLPFLPPAGAPPPFQREKEAPCPASYGGAQTFPPGKTWVLRGVWGLEGHFPGQTSKLRDGLGVGVLVRGRERERFSFVRYKCAAF